MKGRIILPLALLALLLSACTMPVDSTASKPELEQIRSICNLATLECYYHNVAKGTKAAGSGFAYIGEIDRKFWIEYTGVAKIGIDMSRVSMEIEGENVTIFIPNARLQQLDILEDDLDEDSYIASKDSWFNRNKITAEDQTKAISAAQEAMRREMEGNTALLLSARDRAQELLGNYIQRIGEMSGRAYTITWQYE